MDKNTMSSGDAIKAFLKAYRLEDKIVEAKLRSLCDNVLGAVICRKVTDVSFRNHTLTIKVSSAALKQELDFRKSTIIDNLNKELGTETVKRLIIN